MAHHSTTPILECIQRLEAERAALYARAAERRWLDEHERARLMRIRSELARLWDLRRQEKAGAPEMPDNVRDEATFEGRHNRSRQRGGRTWAEAEALLELEVG